MARAEKCPSCGAPLRREFGESCICEYCGSFFPVPDKELGWIIGHGRQTAVKNDRAEVRERTDAECEPFVTEEPPSDSEKANRSTDVYKTGGFLRLFMLAFIVFGFYLMYRVSHYEGLNGGIVLGVLCCLSGTVGFVLSPHK